MSPRSLAVGPSAVVRSGSADADSRVFSPRVETRAANSTSASDALDRDVGAELDVGGGGFTHTGHSKSTHRHSRGMASGAILSAAVVTESDGSTGGPGETTVRS